MYSMFQLTLLFPATFNYLASKHHQLEIHFTAGISSWKYAPRQLEASLRKNPYLKIFRISVEVSGSVSDILLRAISLRTVVTRLLKLTEKYPGCQSDYEEHQHLASLCFPPSSGLNGGREERRPGDGGGGGGGARQVGCSR